MKILLVDAMIYNGYLTNHVIHVPTDDAAPEGEVTGIQGQHRKQFLHVIFFSCDCTYVRLIVKNHIRIL